MTNINKDAIYTEEMLPEFAPLMRRLTKEHKQVVAHLPQNEAKLLVNAYYTAQAERIRSGNRRTRALADKEPSLVLAFYEEQARTLEDYVKALLDEYSQNNVIGQWLRSIKGIGPVLASAHLAFIDIKKAPYAGHIWSYAGLANESMHRGKENAKYSREYRKVCWLTGESFVKVSGRPDAFYGQLYKSFREYEDRMNDRGSYRDKAIAQLATIDYGEDTQARKDLEEGRLPKAQLYARAKRRTVKVFLSHLHHKLYVLEYGMAPPPPYAISILGHYDYIAPPE